MVVKKVSPEAEVGLFLADLERFVEKCLSKSFPDVGYLNDYLLRTQPEREELMKRAADLSLNFQSEVIRLQNKFAKLASPRHVEYAGTFF